VPRDRDPANFYRSWLGKRTYRAVGTNFGAEALPFQNWQKFKEAFTPEIIEKAASESERDVKRLLDPFGGSGTSALTAQFLGIESITVEVNPYMADIIEAKLTHYDVTALDAAMRDYKTELTRNLALTTLGKSEGEGPSLPRSFVEPGHQNRWIYSDDLARYLLGAIAGTSRFSPQVSRLFRVLIGGLLVDVSNVRVSGKGRRYRTNWAERQQTPAQAHDKITKAFDKALAEIRLYNDRPEGNFELIHGDSRQYVATSPVDLVIFSPPYPNSFDYTDVYNVELWMLGYLTNREENHLLRQSTLSSHVQVRRDFSPPPASSPTAIRAVRRLEEIGDQLWNRNLPAMVGSYFADMETILRKSYDALEARGECWMVVGNSQYRGISVPVGDGLVEIARDLGFHLVSSTSTRSMRNAPQQGGQLTLDETLIVLRKP